MIDPKSEDPQGEWRRRIYERYTEGRGFAVLDAPPQELVRLYPYFARLVRQHFPRDPEAAVLDLGCGDGALLAVARALGRRRLAGVDRSPQQARAARDRGLDIRQGELLPTLQTLAAESLDCVVAFDVLEHLQRPELLPLLDQARRVLRPGGRLIAHVPNGESPFVGMVRYGDLTHELAFTRRSLRQLALAAGFSAVECYEDRPLVRGVASAARYALWRGVRAGLRLYLAAEGQTDSQVILSQNLLAVLRR